MIVCTQCLGKGITQGQESVIDQSSNATKFHSPGEKPSGVACTQCNGTGIMKGGSF